MITLTEIKHVRKNLKSTDIRCTFNVNGKLRRITSSSKNPVLTDDAWVCGMSLCDDGMFAVLNVWGMGEVKMTVGQTLTNGVLS